MINTEMRDIDQIVQRYKNGVSQRQLATEFNAGLRTIKRILLESGLRGDWRDRYPLNENAFTEITDEAAYWIGFLMADGSVTKNRISLKLSETDAGHLTSYQSFIGATNHTITNKAYASTLPQGTRGIYSSVSLAFNSAKIASDLAQYGIVERKTQTACFSDDIVFNRFCWLGLIDGDGSLGFANTSPRLFLCGTVYILEQFNAMLKYSMNLNPASIQIKEGKVPQLELYGNRCKDVVRYLWDGHRLGLPRKREIAEKILTTNLMPVGRPRRRTTHGNQPGS
jgi:hypothetical protein